MATTQGNTTRTSLSVEEQTMRRRVKWPSVYVTSTGRKFIVGMYEVFSMPYDEYIVEIDGEPYTDTINRRRASNG